MLRRFAPFLMIALAACARTSLTSFTDPTFAGSKQESVIVMYLLGDLGQRQFAEDVLTETFGKAGVQAVQSYKLAPPTREYSFEEIAGIYKASGYEAVLTVGLERSRVDQAYLPQTTFPGQASATTTWVGNTAYTTIHQTPGYSVGGGTVAIPVSGFAMSLMRVSDGATIWKASAEVSGHQENGFREVARKTVARLAEDGLF